MLDSVLGSRRYEGTNASETTDRSGAVSPTRDNTTVGGNERSQTTQRDELVEGKPTAAPDSDAAATRPVGSSGGQPAQLQAMSKIPVAKGKSAGRVQGLNVGTLRAAGIASTGSLAPPAYSFYDPKRDRTVKIEIFNGGLRMVDGGKTQVLGARKIKELVAKFPEEFHPQLLEQFGLGKFAPKVAPGQPTTVAPARLEALEKARYSILQRVRQELERRMPGDLPVQKQFEVDGYRVKLDIDAVGRPSEPDFRAISRHYGAAAASDAHRKWIGAGGGAEQRYLSSPGCSIKLFVSDARSEIPVGAAHGSAEYKDAWEEVFHRDDYRMMHIKGWQIQMGEFEAW